MTIQPTNPVSTLAPAAPYGGITVQDLLRRGDTEVFRRLIESVKDYAIFLLAPDGTIASWNVGAKRIKGYSAEEAIGKHFSMFYTDDALACGWPAEELRRANAEGHVEDEGWRVRKDGSRFWANVVISPVRDANGALLGFSKVTRDLTERRLHEEELRKREEKFRLLVEGVKDHAMFLLDAKGRIRTWNFGAKRLFNYVDTDALDQFFSLLHPPQDATGGRMQSELAAAHAGGFIQSEGWYQRADGARFWAESSTSVLRDPTERLQGYVQIVRDLTARKRIETLEAEGRRLSEFIAVLSHELRNPLAPIRNAISILKNWAVQPESAWCVDLIGRQVDHMTRMVEDLMDVSRITSGKIRLETVPLDLGTLVRMAVDASCGLLDAHSHQLELSIPSRLVSVQGDGTRLTQVIVNLLTNAAKYTPSHGRISLSLTTDDQVATLQVSDNGIGMSMALLKQAFDPFVQGARGLDRSEGGLGIGLTLVKHIVELHGGTVSAASAGTNLGSTLTLTLPLSRGALPAVERVTSGAATTKRRVLVVDDNRDAAETLAIVLRLFGHDVHVVYDGPRALQAVESLRPDVVLLDIGLPGMNGVEVGLRIKKLPGLENIRLIAVTGYGQSSDREATRNAGFDLHMTKPIDPDQIGKLLG